MAASKLGMHSADIVAAVKKTGTNLRQLALKNGFAASTLRAALHKPHPRAQRLIATTIGKSVHEIWPQWFDATGERIRPRPARHPHHRSTTSAPLSNQPMPKVA